MRTFISLKENIIKITTADEGDFQRNIQESLIILKIKNDVHRINDIFIMLYRKNVDDDEEMVLLLLLMRMSLVPDNIS